MLGLIFAPNGCDFDFRQGAKFALPECLLKCKPPRDPESKMLSQRKLHVKTIITVGCAAQPCLTTYRDTMSLCQIKLIMAFYQAVQISAIYISATYINLAQEHN